MGVSSSAGVMAREDGLELHDTVGRGGLDATVECLFGVGLVGAVSVAVGDDAGVDACGVGVPDLDVGVGDGLAGLDVEYLHVEVEREAGLFVG